MSENPLRKSAEEIFRSEIEPKPENTEVLGIGLDADNLNALITVLCEQDTPLRVRVLTSETALKDLRRDFIQSANAAELIEDDILGVRTPVDGDVLSTVHNLLLTPEDAITVVPITESSGTLRADNGSGEAFAETLYEHFNEAFEVGEKFNLRTPSRKRISETLTEEFGGDVEKTFSELLQEVDADVDEGGTKTPDPARIALLAAAAHEELLYDISKWGEDVGLASKATFSRTKNNLEEQGLIDTTKVPIDIGRPRLRLQRTDKDL